MKTLIVYSKRHTSIDELLFFKSLKKTEYCYLKIEDSLEFFKYFRKIGLSFFLIFFEVFLKKIKKKSSTGIDGLNFIPPNEFNKKYLKFIYNYNCKIDLSELSNKKEIPLITMSNDNSLNKIINNNPYLNGELKLGFFNNVIGLYHFQIPNTISLLINDKVLNISALQIFIDIKKSVGTLTQKELIIKNEIIRVNLFSNLKYLLLGFKFLFNLKKTNSKGYSVYYKLKNSNIEYQIKPKNDNNFFADPFVFEYDNLNIIFHEEYDSKLNRGVISATSVNKEKSQYLGIVLNECFHLSFPFVFEDKGKIYMIPETHQTNSIRLYECESFPLKWKFKKTLINKIDSADNILFKKNDTYFLLANKKFGSYHGGMNIYYSKDLFSNSWTSHVNNPIEVKYESRNAGILNLDIGPVFVRQYYKYLSYGDFIKLYDLEEINTKNANFILSKKIIPAYLKNSHHYNTSKNYEVYDKKNTETSRFNFIK